MEEQKPHKNKEFLAFVRLFCENERTIFLIQKIVVSLHSK
jgi:hypothetical protein